MATKVHWISSVETVQIFLKKKNLMGCVPQSKKIDLYINRKYYIHDLYLNISTNILFI